MKELEKVIAVRVSSINDIARMAASLVSMGQPTYIIRYRSEDRSVYGIFAVFRDYYKNYGLPMVYYHVVEGGEDGDKNYIAIRSDEVGETVSFVKGPKPGWVTIPIVNVAAPPPFMPENL